VNHRKPLTTVRCDDSWIDLCHSAIALFMRDRDFTIDDIYGLVPQPPCHNHYGAMMASLKQHGAIKVAGYTVSKRPSANGRRVLQWRLQ